MLRSSQTSFQKTSHKIHGKLEFKEGKMVMTKVVQEVQSSGENQLQRSRDLGRLESLQILKARISRIGIRMREGDSICLIDRKPDNPREEEGPPPPAPPIAKEPHITIALTTKARIIASSADSLEIQLALSFQRRSSFKSARLHLDPHIRMNSSFRIKQNCLR